MVNNKLYAFDSLMEYSVSLQFTMLPINELDAQVGASLERRKTLESCAEAEHLHQTEDAT